VGRIRKVSLEKVKALKQADFLLLRFILLLFFLKNLFDLFKIDHINLVLWTINGFFILNEMINV